MNDVPIKVNSQEKPGVRTGPAWFFLGVMTILPVALPINILLWQAVVGVR